MRIVLSEETMQKAIEEGHIRHNWDSVRRPRFGARFDSKEENLKKDISGAMAELVVALVTGKRWRGDEHRSPSTYKLPDVGDDIQVRSTAYPNGHLLVYRDADPSQWYFLVICEYPNPECMLPGFILARDAMETRYWNELRKGSAYWIPQIDLTPVPKEIYLSHG